MDVEAGSSEQACNECKRRKARCDRRLPQCTPCSRSSRHCLYHKHSRTPLTRRHLTTVEEHLRQTQKQLQCMQRRALAAEAKQYNGESGDVDHRVPPAATTPVMGDESAREDSYAAYTPLIRAPQGVNGQRVHGEGAAVAASGPSPVATIRSVHSDGVAALGEQVHPKARREQVKDQTEGHISDAEDLSWDEQTPSKASAVSLGVSGADERASAADGMASLSVDARGSGYLGVASGAAMLRLLLPADKHRQLTTPAFSAEPELTQSARIPRAHGWVPTPLYHERKIASIDLDAAIDAYFSLYHVSYPIVHEPTFRAQYMQVIPRASGKSWNALAYIIGALGIFTKASGAEERDLDLFEAAKSNINLESLESGNVTLVQTLTLMSNYLQKRNKPNSGYNYLGLALHMAMGIGLHRDFASPKVRPLATEIRRRVWWTLQVFAVGAMITFGRPLSWPAYGVEALLPLNIDERDLTHASTFLPAAREGLTTYSSVIWQARFHLATNAIYTKVTNASFSSVDELLALDDENIEPWRQQWASQAEELPPKFRLSRSIMQWRYRNFRTIMYRPFVIRQALQSQSIDTESIQADASKSAVARCMHEARESIYSIGQYWSNGERNRMSAWYALYFLFQATLIPCVRLRNEPGSEHAQDWRTQIRTALDTIENIGALNQASSECHAIISKLCAAYLSSQPDELSGVTDPMLLQPIEESPMTQIDNLYSMMWPGMDVFDFGMDNQYTQDNFDFNTAFDMNP